MIFYAGLDVSLRETSVCIVDGDGKVVLERKVESEPEAIAPVLQAYAADLRLVGVEASSLGSWLHTELVTRGFEAVVIEAFHTHVALSTMRNKTDRNDARGIAQLMRLGWYKVVHVKSMEAAAAAHAVGLPQAGGAQAGRRGERDPGHVARLRTEGWQHQSRPLRRSGHRVV